MYINAYIIYVNAQWGRHRWCLILSTPFFFSSKEIKWRFLNIRGDYFFHSLLYPCVPGKWRRSFRLCIPYAWFNVCFSGLVSGVKCTYQTTFINKLGCFDTYVLHCIGPMRDISRQNIWVIFLSRLLFHASIVFHKKSLWEFLFFSNFRCK